MPNWTERGQRRRRMLVGIRWRPDNPMEASAEALLRAGAGVTAVTEVEPPGWQHVSGPIFWLEPWDDEDRGWAECANCGDISKAYLSSHVRYAQTWAHRHRCP